MAKQTVSVVERHVEKGVLGVALVCLIYVVVTNLLTTPNRIDLGASQANPATVDRLVLEQATRVREAIRSSNAPESEFEPRAAEFAKANDPLAFAGIASSWPRTVSFGLPVPEVGLKPIVPGTIQLADVIQLPKPTLLAGRSTIDFVASPDRYRVGYRDGQLLEVATAKFAVNWVRVASTFDADAQKRMDAKVYGGDQKPLVAAVQTQRRARRPDGSWNDEDWQDVRGYSTEVMPGVTPIRLEPGAEGELRVNIEDLDEISSHARILKDPNVAVNILRPLFPRVYDGDVWPHPGIEVMAQDTSVLFPGEQLRPGDYHDRYTVVVQKKDQQADEPGPDTNHRAYVADRMAEFDRAFAQQDENGQIIAYNKIFYYVKNATNFDPGIVALAQSKADEMNRLMADWKSKISAWEKDNERRRIIGIPEKPAPNPCDMLPPERCVQAPEVGTPTSQMVWTHDAWLDSVQGGRTYQYRMRVALMNPFAGEPKQLKDPRQATQWFIEGPWSQPSDPIYIQPETQFFVKSASRSRGVSIDVFKWHQGVWVSSSFSADVWEEVGGDARARVPDENDPTPLINFRTGVTVVAVDFDRQMRPRERAGREGIEFGRPEETVVVTLMDASGELSERIMDVDKANPEYAALKRRIYRPPPKPREEVDPELGPRDRGPKP